LRKSLAAYASSIAKIVLSAAIEAKKRTRVTIRPMRKNSAFNSFRKTNKSLTPNPHQCNLARKQFLNNGSIFALE